MATTGTVALAAEVKPLYPKKKRRAKKKPAAPKKVAAKKTKRG